MSVPLKVFSEEGTIESSALEQAIRITSLPSVFKHVALMPDAHMGIGACIGAVAAFTDIVVPSIVGVDIGCGMCAVKTSYPNLDREVLKKIMGRTRQTVPVGFDHHSVPQEEKYMPPINEELPIVQSQSKRALTQIGTLGGGNHFIDFHQGSDGFIWVVVHSGSRNIGKKVADHYNWLAIELNKDMPEQVPPEWQLAFLLLDSDEGQLYLKEMQYCVDFALANRKLMMDRIIEIMKSEAPPQEEFGEVINIAHNFASTEEHFGEEVVVHRKGATQAFAEQLGIVPGSQGAETYIVKGKGNPESFMSCAHGAGRVMGRKHAIRTLDLQTEIKKLEDQGILHGVRGKRDLDEAPSVYKDINWVMDQQKDLVEVVAKLSPLGVVKG